MERRKYFEVFFNQNNMTHTVSLLFHACDYKYWQSIIPHENYKITIERICNTISQFDANEKQKAQKALIIWAAIQKQGIEKFK